MTAMDIIVYGHGKDIPNSNFLRSTSLQSNTLK